MSVLTHRKRRLREEASHHHVKRLNRGFKLRSKKRDYKKPEYFINEFRRAERDEKRMRRVIYTRNLFAGDNSDSKVLVAMRHRAHKIASEECTLILKSLGLYRIHNTVLLKNDPESIALLKLVEPYVTYGYPTIQTVRDLIFKHGYLSVDGKKTPMNSNKLIEDHLGKYGIICIEDIVHALFTVSDNFKNIRGQLLPFVVSVEHFSFSAISQQTRSRYQRLLIYFSNFQLKAPRDGWSKKIGVSFQRGGEYGNRKSEINALIERCL